MKLVIIKNGVKEIDSRAFYNCTSLEKIALPQGLKFICQSAFKGCESLTEITIPDSVKIIEERAFYGCKNLKKINIPKEIERIGKNVFFGCEKLVFSDEINHLIEEKTIDSPKNIDLVEDFYYFCLANSHYLTSMKKVSINYGKIIIPQGITEIGNYGLSDLNVKEVILPSTLKIIKRGAFKNCKRLRKIYIPKSVEIIEDDAFLGCNKLEIYCEKEPAQGWLNEKETKKIYHEDMTDAFNFHRSGGSFDDHYVVERVEIIHNNFNPDRRPLHLNITFENYDKINY